MDDDRELIDRLCTKAGMIMEDASAEAVVIGQGPDQLREKLEKIRKSAADAATLTAAAAVVFERSRAI